MKQITIAGGGLAGLALGIGLRLREVPATICEAGRYPRHRVCGEFLSGQGQDSLSRLGLLPLLEQAGARRAREVALIAEDSKSRSFRLPSPALCLSRYRLDKALADEFVRLGGNLEVEKPWRGSLALEGLVGATGRRNTPPTGASNRWFGLKAHFRGLPLKADLELHLQPHGYIGLCKLDGGEVNVCGLFRALPDRHPVATGKVEFLLGLADAGLRRRMESAAVDESSCCSVAGLNYQPQHEASPAECRIGDCVALIPPVTGNGMSMALEAAELAVEPLTQFSHGRIGWHEAVGLVHRGSRQRFARRLACARVVHRLILSSWTRRGLKLLLFHSDPAWRLMFGLTR